MSSLTRVVAAVLIATVVAGCTATDGDDDATGTPTPSATPSESSPAGDDGTPSAVPTAEELTGMLATQAELGEAWTLWEGFGDWPAGSPGVIPEEQRTMLPTLPMCPTAGDDAVALAEGLRWQAFTQLRRATPDPFGTMVVVQQMMLAEDPAQLEVTFATLAEGLTSCLTANLPDGEWEIGLREELTVPAVGDARYAERASSVNAGDARRDTRLVLVLDGAVLMAIQLDEVLISPEAEPTVTDADLDALVSAMAAQLP